VNAADIDGFFHDFGSSTSLSTNLAACGLPNGLHYCIYRQGFAISILAPQGNRIKMGRLTWYEIGLIINHRGHREKQRNMAHPMFQACFQPQMKFRWRPHWIQVTELDGKQTNEPKLGALGVLGGEKNDLMQLPWDRRRGIWRVTFTFLLSSNKTYQASTRRGFSIVIASSVSSSTPLARKRSKNPVNT